MGCLIHLLKTNPISSSKNSKFSKVRAFITQSVIPKPPIYFNYFSLYLPFNFSMRLVAVFFIPRQFVPFRNQTNVSYLHLRQFVLIWKNDIPQRFFFEIQVNQVYLFFSYDLTWNPQPKSHTKLRRLGIVIPNLRDVAPRYFHLVRVVYEQISRGI